MKTSHNGLYFRLVEAQKYFIVMIKTTVYLFLNIIVFDYFL
jgi:hypothetical protein